MPLKLMYITNNPKVASIAEKYGVDRIFVDLETLGKEERQHNMNTVKSHHTINDVAVIRKAISKAELLVRVNPINPLSKEEIDCVIENGADIIMLPMFETVSEVKEFIQFVNGRAKIMLLVETKKAMESLNDISRISGIDEIHIGLNDLHLQLNKRFMFELLSDGTVESMCKILQKSPVKRYGFGGIARLDEGLIPARHIIAEHYRLGSTMAILSRSFYDSWLNDDIEEISRVFKYGLIEIREYEKRLEKEDFVFFKNNSSILKEEIKSVLMRINKCEN